MSEISDHTLLICTSCKGKAHARALSDMLRQTLPHGFAVRPVACMAGCAYPTTVGFQAAGKAHYLFGQIETPSDLAALAEFAHHYATSVDGWTAATERPAALLHKTLSRMPAMRPAGAQP